MKDFEYKDEHLTVSYIEEKQMVRIEMSDEDDNGDKRPIIPTIIIPVKHLTHIPLTRTVIRENNDIGYPEKANIVADVAHAINMDTVDLDDIVKVISTRIPKLTVDDKRIGDFDDIDFDMYTTTIMTKDGQIHDIDENYPMNIGEDEY